MWLEVRHRIHMYHFQEMSDNLLIETALWSLTRKKKHVSRLYLMNINCWHRTFRISCGTRIGTNLLCQRSVMVLCLEFQAAARELPQSRLQQHPWLL